MLISVNGSDGTQLCQIQGLKRGFAALGHEHLNELDSLDTSFIFVGNPPYEDFLPLAGKKKLIFNVLDLALHCREHPQIVENFKNNLPQADAITCISNSVARDIQNFCGLKSEVIYYPMKPVKYNPDLKKNHFKAALVGRLNDPNKRADVALSALLRAGYNSDEIAIVGPEYPGWGTYCGVVNDNDLEIIYNSVDYVLMFSKYEGIGLPAIEAACCGAIPIVLPDLSTFNEFWIQSPLGLHYQYLNSTEKVVDLLNVINSNIPWKNEIKQDMVAYSNLFFRPKFDEIEVAKKIIRIYHVL